ncbi:hypothetical protein Ahy_B05g073910 isoform B [Arachis hypogaea]|uniref:Uncharacterized protein n=1 Tax=Arachis hypogaea TaxID=3818 RepID=A0A444YXG6_ARAHY|nr:hypothetical protein Ahy_B05g073910 isoform B [Arachis hypogaea]
MATTEKSSLARERPMLAVVVVLPTPPFPEVTTTTRGVSPESWGLRFHWRRAVGDLWNFGGFGRVLDWGKRNVGRRGGWVKVEVDGKSGGLAVGTPGRRWRESIAELRGLCQHIYDNLSKRISSILYRQFVLVFSDVI